MRPLLVKTHPYDSTVEGLRGLRATLQFGLIDAPNRIVAITSPAPSAQAGAAPRLQKRADVHMKTRS